jgi:PDZ domain-containing protein
MKVLTLAHAQNNQLPAITSNSRSTSKISVPTKSMKMKSIFTITIILFLHLAAVAQTSSAPPEPPTPPHPPGVPGHHEKGPKVPVTYLGVETSQVPDVVSEQLGLAKGLGLVVEYVAPNSPAASAGIQQNDILKMLNDQILIEPSQLRKLLQTFSEGTEVTLTILRKGKEQKVTAKLAQKEVPQRHSLIPEGNHDWHWDFDETGDLGEQMQELKEQLKEQLGDAQRGIIRGAVMKAHEAARRAREDARRAAREIRILSRDNGAFRATRIDLGNAQIVFSDDKGQLKLENVDGKKLLIVKDPQGKLLFSGPVETREDLDKVPADVRERYEKLQQNELPAVAPRDNAEKEDDTDTDDDEAANPEPLSEQVSLDPFFADKIALNSV